MSPSAALFVAALLSAGPIDADVVLRGGTVYDGSGEPGAVADVAIKGDRIVAIGQFEAPASAKIIDAKGLIVAPGFIDLHTHSDEGIVKEKTRQNANYLMQGVTSIVTGNCGSGPVDVGKYLAEIEKAGAGTNVLHLVCHGSVRAQVMSQANRPPSPEELAKICELSDRGMQDGAWGMSTGLIYTPGSFSKTDELVTVAEVVSKHGGIYVSHIRNEASQLLESIDELLTIGRQAKLPVHVSHIKVSGKGNWGLAPDAIAKLRAARDSGMQVTADQYPYTASSTSLAAMVIPSEFRGERLKEALADAEQSKKVKAEIQKGLDGRDSGERIVVANFAADRTWQGKSIAQIAKDANQSPLDVVLSIMDRGGASAINFGMNEDEVRLFMREPFVATASDGSTQPLDAPTQPHPRSFGCFPRKIGYYAIEGKVLPLEQAIRSASGLPADILRLPERGYLRPGYYADIVVFDPAKFRDTATFEKPLQWATGVKLLLVNGKTAVQHEKPTDELAGRVLRHESAAKTGGQ